MGIIQIGRVEIAYETSGSGEAGVVILIRGQGLFSDPDGRGGRARSARRCAHHGVFRALVRRD